MAPPKNILKSSKKESCNYLQKKEKYTQHNHFEDTNIFEICKQLKNFHVYTLSEKLSIKNASKMKNKSVKDDINGI